MNEDKARELIQTCEQSIKESSASEREKNQLKAELLYHMIEVNAVNDTVVSLESVQALYKEVSSAEKLNRTTKKMLEEIQQMLPVSYVCRKQ